MKKWSKYFQNPAFLELTRMNLIREEFRPAVLEWCGIKEGMKVLDVGCGTGYFTRYIGEGDIKLNITGLDYDEVFLDIAGKYETCVSQYNYVQGDAHELPFDDESFDAVVSHTFFTTIDEPDKAMKEMKRVCKTCGTIAAVTPMNLVYSIYSPGHYPKECQWVQPLGEAGKKLQDAYDKVNGVSNYIQGIKPEEMPYFFHLCSLKNVSAYPVGKLFSFSDASLKKTDRERYIELLYESEENKLKEYLLLEEFTSEFSPAQSEEYLNLLKQKCSYLKEHVDDNSIWEIQGGANLLTVGVNPMKIRLPFLEK